jgi:hypothetical protein
MRMDSKRKSYLLLLLGFLGALFFLIVKIALYDKLEYELDIFSILQLSRDYWLGKPFLYENFYGDNKAIHNYYLVPIFSPLTLILGGKGLFIAGFLLMLWALYLVSRLLKELPWGKGLLFLMLFFSPTAFFLWDNFRFGWHPESFYYPLAIVFMAALILNRKFSAWVAAICIILNREDGILIALSIYIIYEAAKNKDTAWILMKRMVPVIIVGGIIFLTGLLVLSLFSSGESRIGIAMQRFVDNYNTTNFILYMWKSARNWFLLCGTVWVLALFFIRKHAFFFWSFICLIPIMLVNFYAAAYYFPDLRYGINWAPRLAGTYGILMSMLLVSMFYGNHNLNIRHQLVLPLVGVIIFAFQIIGLRTVPYENIGYRVNLALFLPPQKEDVKVINDLKAIAARIPTSYPIQLDWRLFSLFDHTNFIWSDEKSKPFCAPKLLIISETNPYSRPVPEGFEKISQVGKYGVWADPNDQEAKSFVKD